MDLVLRERLGPGVGAQPVEIVERKGLGHPDTICDAVAEEVCVALCRFYRERFDAVLHHNVDKVLLCAGSARAGFGGGAVLEPMELHLAGRATTEHRGVRVPVHELAIAATRRWLQTHLRDLDVDHAVRVTSHLRPSSADLKGLFVRGEGHALANDTSMGAGFAPLTDLERAVLAVERALNAPGTQAAHPALGQDVKVMGVRRSRRIHLTVGCALVGSHLRDVASYERCKAEATAIVLDAARAVTDMDVDAQLNAADSPERGELYLTVTGTSAEAGDDGEVGRGNRVNGLITPYRPMSIEAAAGKNPMTHTGKLYNLVAERVSQRLASLLGGSAACTLVSQIGSPVVEPQVVDVELSGVPDVEGARPRVEACVREALQDLPTLAEALLQGRVGLF